MSSGLGDGGFGDRDEDDLEIIELDDLELLRPETVDAEPIDDLWIDFIETAERELAGDISPEAAASLHYQIALVYELVRKDADAACQRFLTAVELFPDHLESVRGARRLLLERGAVADALPLLESEIALTSDAARRARLHTLRGRLLDEVLGDRDAARSAYQTAIELAPKDQAAIHAAITCARIDGDWTAVDDLYALAANATADPSVRAAYLAERAALAEIKFSDSRAAAELYEAALASDPGHPLAIRALDRIYSERGDWALLRDVLIRAAQRESDPEERAMWLYRCSRVQRWNLEDRRAARASLTQAARVAPGNRLILEELADLHRVDHELGALGDVLGQLVEVTGDAAARCALHHARGQVLAQEPDRVDESLRCYRDALEIDPTFTPALRALGERLAASENWPALIEMHLAEASATADTPRRASAHIRIAEIYESRLDNLAEAASHYEHALALAPAHPAPFKALVRLFARAGEHRRLVEIYERAVDIAPSVERKISHLLKIGSLWEDALDDPEQAAQAYRRILDLIPDDLGAITALQRVSEVAGKYRDLVDYLLREVEISSDTILVVGLQHRAAVVLDEKLGDTPAATRLLGKALEIDPTYVPALASLGRIYHREGRWNELYEMYERELDVIGDPRKRAISLTKMGELCEHQLGDKERAIDAYRSAVDADPGYRPGTRALGRALLAGGQHAGLVDLLAVELGQQTSPEERSLTLFRMAELCAGALSDIDTAIEHCKAALREQPDAATPARMLLENLLARAELWDDLDELLERSEDGDDPSIALRASAARADLWRDRLGSAAAAAEPLSRALARGVELTSATALQQIYAGLGDREAFVRTSLAIADATVDDDTRAATLRAVIDALDELPAPDLPTRVELLAQLAELAPADVEALDELARTSADAGDVETEIRSFSQLAAGGSRRAQADAWLRLGLALEASGDPRGAAVYQRAFDAAPELLAAIRAVGRVAREARDVAGQASALRREAEIRTDPAARGALLVGAGRLLLEAGLEADAAQADVEAALAHWPDNAEAAALLEQTLRARGDHDRLINVLSRAAQMAKTPERQASLWLSVGRAYAELGNQGAAISSIRRGLEARPVDLPCLLELAELYSLDGQWNEAATVLEDALSAEISDAERCDLLLEQSRMWSQRLGKPDRALGCVEDALALMPSRRDLQVAAVRLRLQLGFIEDAGFAADDLFAAAGEPGERAEALVLQAEVAAARDDDDDALRHLAEAVALVGSAGEGERSALASLRAVAERTNGWQLVASSLLTFIRGASGEARTAATRALAEVYGVDMGLPKKAAELLADAVRVEPNAALIGDLIEQLIAAGDLEGAIRYQTLLVGSEPRSPAAWRALAQLCERLARRADAARAAQALSVLGAALEPDEAKRLAAVRPAAALVEGALGAEVVHSVAQAGVTAGAQAQIVASLTEAIGKVLDHDLRDAGLTRKHRVQNFPDHPLARVVDRIVSLTGVKCEVYLVSGIERLALLGLKDPPILALDGALGKLDEAEQLFVVTRALALAAAGLHGFAALSTAEVGRVLAAVGSEQDELRKSLWKAQPRRARKSFEAAVAALADEPALPPHTLRSRVLRAANRVACVVAGDIGAAIRAHGRIAREEGGDAASERREADAMLAFWLSQPAASLRQRLGIP